MNANELITREDCWIQVGESTYTGEKITRLVIDLRDRCVIVKLTKDERTRLSNMLSIPNAPNVKFLIKQIEFVKSLHVKMLYGDKSGYGCECCRDNWPCSTITELTKEEE